MTTGFLNMSNTGVVMTVCGVVLLTWEVLAFVYGKKQALISTWFQQLGFRSPAAVFVIGALAGHFWMYFPPTVSNAPVQCPQCAAWLILNVDANSSAVTATLSAKK